MNGAMPTTVLLYFAGGTAATLLILAGFLHLLPRLGGFGNMVTGWLAKAPGLDLAVTVFTVVPWVAGAFAFGWGGVAAAIAGQIVATYGWSLLHEMAHREAVKGPRITKVLNARVGWLRNHTALWVTTLAVPMFWMVRVAEWLVYPPLVWLVSFPRYPMGEWVNVSRQKFQGLVGWDLIWCLYCDWMTGVWSLGTEMLRNVESFWCPIRFDSEKKCENCRIDFPDLDSGWVRANGTMGEVADLLEEKYPGGGHGKYSWFGHPARKGCGGGGCGSCDSSEQGNHE